MCDRLGSDSKQCAVARDVVEELQAKASHKPQGPEKTPFETYTDRH